MEMNKRMLFLIFLGCFNYAFPACCENQSLFGCYNNRCDVLYFGGGVKEWELDSIIIRPLDGKILWRFAEPQYVGGDGRATSTVGIDFPVGDSVFVVVYSNQGLWKKKKRIENEMKYEDSEEDDD